MSGEIWSIFQFLLTKICLIFHSIYLKNIAQRGFHLFVFCFPGIRHARFPIFFKLASRTVYLTDFIFLEKLKVFFSTSLFLI